MRDCQRELMYRKMTAPSLTALSNLVIGKFGNLNPKPEGMVFPITRLRNSPITQFPKEPHAEE
jgi:hypothetical protein